MEEQHQPDRFTSPSECRNGEYSGAVSSTTSVSQVQVDGAEDVGNIEELPLMHRNREYSGGYSQGARFMTRGNEGSRVIIVDSWACIITVLAFWFVVSMTLIWGVYGSANLQLGPNSSILIKPNQLFVDSIKVEELDGREGPILYGFYKDPPLDVSTTWSETRKTILPAGNHKEWRYFLNKGSQINISYSTNSLLSSALILVIAEGNEGFAKWLEDPSHPNTTLSWNTIQGNGIIQQELHKSSTYYIAVGNLNFEASEVQLSIGIKAFLYNTKSAYYKCMPAQGRCSMKLLSCGANAALLTTPDQKSGMASGYWNVKLSYGPRCITYLVSIFVMTILVLFVYHILNHLPHTGHDERRYQFGTVVEQRTPLLSHKDEDLSSWGSSYDSISEDEECAEDRWSGISLDAKRAIDREYSNNIHCLCLICFDAPREYFFLPCGHYVACFACVTRILEATKSCPICHRQVKKMRKIFMV